MPNTDFFFFSSETATAAANIWKSDNNKANPDNLGKYIVKILEKVG